MPKRSIRSQLLQKRRDCSAALCRELGLQIQTRFLQTELFRQAECLALYSPMHNEVETAEVARQGLLLGKRMVYPRVVGELLEFVEVCRPDQMTPGAFGIPEPCGSQPVPFAAIDLLIIPGIAFDFAGHRLGYGKGFYDRVLAGCRPDAELVGFGYDFQVVERLPAEVHDRPLTVLVTETRLLRFAP